MNDADRIDRWLDELEATLARSTALVGRGRDAYDSDDAIPLAFEALSNRVGDLAKRLITADPERFSHSTWRAAARRRDFVVHHYGRIDIEILWSTVTVAFPELAVLVRGNRQSPTSPD